MFKAAYQKGCFSVFYSLGSEPLSNWQVYKQNGYVKRIVDEDIKSTVLEIMGTNVSTMFMYIPRQPNLSLGVKLPFLVLLIKNLHKYFTFEIKVMDDTRFFRRFRVSNFQSKTSIKPFCTAMPMGMSPGWNQIHFNLAEFTRRAYGTNYMETVRLQIHANVRIRRIFFTDRLYTDDELPNEFRLMAKPKVASKKIKEYKVPSARPPSPAKTETTVEVEKARPPLASILAMYRTVYQNGCFSIFFSVGGNPLREWRTHAENGHVKRILDDDIKTLVLEIVGTNVSTMFITTPKEPKASLGIKLPFLVLLIKNLHKYFTFEVKIIDDQRFYRRFRVSNFQSKTSIKPFCTTMPMGMSPGWNQIHFNLADFTRRAYGTNYMETVRLQIHANVRIRRIYFTDRLYVEDELPAEFRLMPKLHESSSKIPKVPGARPPSPAKSNLTEEMQDRDPQTLKRVDSGIKEKSDHGF